MGVVGHGSTPFFYDKYAYSHWVARSVSSRPGAQSALSVFDTAFASKGQSCSALPTMSTGTRCA